MSHDIKHKNDSRYRVAILLLGGKQWLGGYNYIRNLCTALVQYAPEIVPVLFAGEETEELILEPFAKMKIEVIRDKIFDDKHRRTISIQSIFFGKVPDIERLFTHNKIDVVFENNVYFGWRTKFPTITWLPDFQHKYLSRMFTNLAWLKRELGFRIITFSPRIIMLSSMDAKKDCQIFYNVADERIFVVPFAVEPPKIDQLYLQECLNKYEIGQPFFYLPNQFWRHKNHTAVIEALHQVNAGDMKNILIVSSGSTQDSRNLGYIDEVQGLIKKYSLKNEFRLLGMVPYKDVIHLMNAACAVINPSFFEGWSTTVEEAKALKKTLVLSNISVHREQVNDNAYFFDPLIPEELSNILQTFQCEMNLPNAGDVDNSIQVNEFAQKFSGMIKSMVM